MMHLRCVTGIRRVYNVLVARTLNDELRYRYQFTLISGMLCIISAVMTIVNIISSTYPLMYVTLGFAVLCAGCAMLSLLCKKIMAPMIIFSMAIIVLFTYFLISGGTEGFSTIWICLLPAGGMILYGRKNGSIICGVMLLLNVFFLWTNVGNSLLRYECTDAFKTRFPIVFVCFYFVALLFEIIRENTYGSLVKLKNNYQELYLLDALTGVSNRYGFNKTLSERFSRADGASASLIIMDIDHFKRVNDRYGHLIGDIVLRRTAERIAEVVGERGTVCRWGGEEFAVLMKGEMSISDTEEFCEQLRAAVENERIIANGNEISITVSVGEAHATAPTTATITDVINQADRNLYEAKDKGRNCCVCGMIEYTVGCGREE